MQQYDVIIIGGGPIGLTCAIEAEKTGLSHLVLEKGVLVNSLFYFPTNMTFFSTSNLLEIGDVPFIAHGDKPTRREALEYYRRVWQSWKLNVRLYERVQDVVASSEQSYQVISDKGSYSTKHVIVAIGFFDKEVKLNVPGEDLPKVKHYYDEAHPYIGQKVIVVGAANSACDVALETYLKGSEVTMVIRESVIYEGVKYWIRPNIENRIKEGSITAYFDSTVKEIKPEEVIIRTPKGVVTVSNDFVLAMTGYQPDYSLLEKIGIATQEDKYRTPVYDEETLETNLPGIYLAGVICGGLKTNKFFIENSRIHAQQIIRHITQTIQV
ncbi:MAG: YpdA family putative bacillithiol disulfide reductase [Saprospiraceae bacterium]|nr:YpdA family putative bacillithiol disulfide reductase [Saprospiraceae bacterium]